MKLSGKTAIVTGATSGIGRTIAVRFAAEGAVVALVGRNTERLNEATREIRSAGGTCVAIQADLYKLADILMVVSTALAQLHRIDILVNSAGIFEMSDFVEISEESFDRTMHLNARAPFFLSREVAKSMKAKRKGKIINIASHGGGKIGFAQGSVYCMSKGALVALTQALAVELGPFQINVNAISPGTVRTPMNEKLIQDDPAFLAAEIAGTPLGRVADTSDIAGAALFLASDESDLITGIQIVIDGGFSAQ